MFAIDLGDGAELRPLEPWQAQEYLDHMDRARETVNQWIPWPEYSPDLESARTLLQVWADRAAADEGRLFGIWLDGTLVGGTMYVSFNVKFGACELGCWLEPAARGRGLITRSATHLVDWALDVRGLHRIEWRCRTDNVASSNVARRLGMQLDGVLRGEFPFHGVRYDTEVWSLIAPDRTP